MDGQILCDAQMQYQAALDRAGIDSATVDRALFPDCRQACFTVDSDKKIKK